MTDGNFWEGAAIIAAITREQMIEDGVLVDISGVYPQEVKEAGIRCHVAMTNTAWSQTIKVDGNDYAEMMGCDEPGRAWDMFTAWKYAVSQSEDGGDQSQIIFEYIVATDKAMETVALKCIIGPGDKGEMVLTFLLPEED